MTAEHIASHTVARPGRRPELDAIRTLVVVGLVFFHSALVFDTRDDYYVKNAETTDATMIGAGLGVVWAMPMLFLIAGLGSWHSLRRRGPGGFARERLLRLGVPLVFATLTLIPLPQWIRLRADPGYHESYLSFLPRFFEVRLEPAEFPFVLQGEHFETGHLWFVVLLLAFSLILAPVIRLLPRERGRMIRDRLAETVARRRGAILLPAVPLAVISALLGLEEGYAGWHRWAYLLFFLYGFVLASDERFRAAMRRDAVPAAVLGVLLFLVGMPAFMGAGESGGDPFTDMTALSIGGRTLYGAAGWCWVVAILGLLDRRRRRPAPEPMPVPVLALTPDPDPSSDRDLNPDPGLNRDRDRNPDPGRDEGPRGGLGGRLYGYLAVGALPLYILHQPVVVSVAYGVVGWDAPMLVKYLVIVAISLALTVAAYDLLVRRTRVTRFLFGMRG